MADTARKTTNGYQRVMDFLREQLLSGALKEGDVLLPERDLCQMLEVSRPVLREALRALSILSVIEIRHGVGSIVRTPDINVLGDFVSFALAQQGDDVMEARIAVECQAARLVVTRSTISGFEKMRRYADEIADTITDPVAGSQADYNFHMALVEASASPALRTLYVAIADLLKRSHFDRREFVGADEETRKQVIDDHYRILTILTEGNADAAEAAIREHFEIGRAIRMRMSLQRG
ncbi:DNA-binding transcriptional regulator, FadR family [Cohaesibacter marisflavi]|uniref:DNA-binding transcriptional regulator, FadR family n=1 Tax=Cohaesibacter marisflavi TaxID=655353 RepID=A0A1I5JBS3_9HYPH|nr:FadR/GntR family transcriptional regulator [Cohaesibacter marisflavi]SFO69816.1 DNA-binding transcriptional regulator, FadR family [Cohaesibacter marisflavi]